MFEILTTPPAPPLSVTPDSTPFREHLDDDSRVRPAWRHLTETFESLGPKELTHRLEQALRLVQENGVTYNVYGDPQGIDRPWALDLIPLIVSSQDWAAIESGVIQRMEVFNQALADLYGPQRLVKERIIPAQLLFANPSFQRTCYNMRAIRERGLTLFASDLARQPDGSWMVLADSTRTPSGMGYALENRIIMSSIFPGLIRECQVFRMAPFLDRLRETLEHLSPRSYENANVVLMTPGPYNETYFEHVYLARYLGLTLAEGEDLAVRNEKLFLKTLRGLQQVDVVLRRVDDDYCDPLELRIDSSLGVVGLSQALHTGHVGMSNPLGSAMLEAPAFRPYLDAICQFFTGETLKHRSAPTWWCGDPGHLKYVKENFDDLLIGPAFTSGTRMYVEPRAMVPEDREELLRAITMRPTEYVAQQEVPLSIAPTWQDGEVTPRYVSMRAFSLREHTGRYTVMPGGMTRFSESGSFARISMQEGSGSKDTWVLSETPVPMYSLLPSDTEPVPLRRSSHNVPSRVADNFLWLGRYCERGDGAVRTLRYLLTRCTDEDGFPSHVEMQGLLRIAQKMWPDVEWTTPFVPKKDAKKSASVEPDAEIGEDLDLQTVLMQGEEQLGAVSKSVLEALFDKEDPSSVRSTLASVQRVAWIVRDKFSQDDWRIIRSLLQDFHSIANSGETPGISDALVALNHAVTGLAAFNGLAMENMTREAGWVFLDLGRRLERAIHTTVILTATLGKPVVPEESTLQAILNICDSPMTYRSRYTNHFQAHAVLDLLLCDESNPRSVAFQIHEVSHHLRLLPGHDAGGLLAEEERIIVRLLADIRLADVTTLCKLDKKQKRPNLTTMLHAVTTDLARFSDLIAQRFFSHTLPAQRLSGIQREP